MRKYLQFSQTTFADSVYMLREVSNQATVRFRIFYVFLAFYAVSAINEWNIYKDVTELEPLWPVFWLNFMGENTTVAIRGLMIFSLLSTLCGAVFSNLRSFRILAFLGLIQYMGLKYSFGKTGHSLHLWLIIGFLLLFLPQNWQELKQAGKDIRYKIFSIFRICQAMILCTYGMAGLGKLGGAIYQLVSGQSNAFSPDAMELHIADRLLQTNSDTLLGPFLIENSIFNPVMMPMAIVVQLFSFVVIFNPKWQKIWAGALIGTHVFNSLAFGINFHPSVFLLGLFFL